MGNKPNKPDNVVIKPDQVSKKIIGVEMDCPVCGSHYPKQTLTSQFTAHLKICLDMSNSDSENDEPIMDYIEGSKAQGLKNKLSLKQDYYVQEKVPIDSSKTKFKWVKRKAIAINNSILNKSILQMRDLGFQQKLYWFRTHLEKGRISWTSGADYMQIQRNNVLMSSLIEVQKVNMHKEVKIQFLGEKVNDAGGLLRQWIHMVMKEMFDEFTGLFTIAHSQDIMYKLKWDQQMDQQFSQELFNLLGIILGKAIFERNPITCYLDKTLLRQLCSQQISLQDIYGYDIELYNSWKFILNNMIDDMGLQTYFTINKKGQKTTEYIQLIQNGKDVLVTDTNKGLYVNSYIQMMCVSMVQKSVKAIQKGLNKVIPTELLSIFEPQQMEMLLYGIPFIDVLEWKQNTQYKGKFNEAHQVIKWFWKLVLKFDQEQLANLLHFSTGSTRVPIQGFKKLQSNRGNFSKFLIESSNYDSKNPYPKGHTCFNRLELPLYPSQGLLVSHVSAVCNNNMDGIFGLD